MAIDHNIYFRTQQQPIYDPAEDDKRQLQMQAQQAQIEGAAQDRQYRLAQAQAATKKEHAKFFGQLASGIKDGAAWDAGIDQAIRLGYPDAEQFRGQFSPELRAAVMAAGGVEDKEQGQAFTLGMGQGRYGPDGKLIAQSPYRPQIIKDDDGNIYEYGGGQSDPDSTFKALIQQESGGRPGVLGPKTAYGQAQGMTQMLPATARQMAQKLGVPFRPDLMTGTTPEAADYQTKLGRTYFDEGLQKYGGDTEKALMYYHGGPDESLWGPKTKAYAAQTLARANGNPIRQLVKGDGKEKAPSGFRWKADGSLEAIPGGPGDKTGSAATLRPIPAASVKGYVENNTSIRKIRNALAAIDATPDALGGKNYIPDFAMQRLDPKGVNARAAVSDIGSLLIHDRSGAAVTVSETPRLRPFVPSSTDTPQAAKEKLNRLMAEIESQQEDLNSIYNPETGYKTLPQIGAARNQSAPSANVIRYDRNGNRIR